MQEGSNRNCARLKQQIGQSWCSCGLCDVGQGKDTTWLGEGHYLEACVIRGMTRMDKMLLTMIEDVVHYLEQW